MFGANQEYSAFSVGNGNVASQVLASMTLFGIMMTLVFRGECESGAYTGGEQALRGNVSDVCTVQLLGRMVAIVCVGAVVVCWA